MKFRVIASAIVLGLLFIVAYCTESLDLDRERQPAVPAAPSAEDNALKGLKIN